VKAPTAVRPVRVLAAGGTIAMASRDGGGATLACLGADADPRAAFAIDDA
jgi:hypothetical protein